MELYCCICLLLFVYLKCRVESAHWALKRVLQISLGDLCGVWNAMNNMMTLQHTKIRASFETSTFNHKRFGKFHVNLITKDLVSSMLKYASWGLR